MSNQLDAARSRRTLLVGLDAVCWPYLQPLLDAGRLPALAALMRRGSHGRLESTMPAWTPTAWATIVTGKNPGKHGVYDMLWHRPGTYSFEPTNAKVRQGTPVWRRLEAGGLRVGLANVPFTHPPDPVDGFVMSGFGAPSETDDLIHPPAERDWVAQHFGDYVPSVDLSGLLADSPGRLLHAESEHQAQQVEIALALAKRRAVDVLIMNLMLPDHANHYMPKMEQVEKAICTTDAHLARLLEDFDPSHVLLISDHGSRRIKGDVLLFHLLRDRGLVQSRPRDSDERLLEVNWVLSRITQEGLGWSGPLERGLRWLAARWLNWSPSVLSAPLWRSIESRMPGAMEHVALEGRIDPEGSLIYPSSIYSGMFYLNVAGREPQGRVCPEDARDIAERVRTVLLDLKDPETGSRLFSAVHLGEELFDGPAAHLGPEIVIDSFDSAWNPSFAYHPPSLGCQPAGFHHRGIEFGWHSRDGIYVFAGPGLAASQFAGPGLRLEALAPLLLYLHDVGIPEDMDGRLPEELLDEALLAAQPPRDMDGDPAFSHEPSTSYSAEEAEELTVRLKALGYLE